MYFYLPHKCRQRILSPYVVHLSSTFYCIYFTSVLNLSLLCFSRNNITSGHVGPKYRRRLRRAAVFFGREGNNLATTTLLPRHAGEGETIAAAIRDCLDYGKNPEKTEGKYISAYECDPATVAEEFLLAKASYKAATGREQKKETDVLCYQIRMAFYPGEITPKEANRIGYELAMRWTKGRHAFLVTTHTDKKHIHCHIYYNSTSLDCSRKFRNFWGSSFALRRLSDRLCLENGLSIVENPKPRSQSKYKHYGEWQKERKRPLNFQERLCLAIDSALAKRPAHGLRLPFGLRCLRSAYPPCTPYIRFLSVRLRFRYPFFSPVPHNTNLGSRYGVRRQLRPLWTFTTD